MKKIWIEPALELFTLESGGTKFTAENFLYSS